jgi:hypothetical protein
VLIAIGQRLIGIGRRLVRIRARLIGIGLGLIQVRRRVVGVQPGPGLDLELLLVPGSALSPVFRLAWV